MISCQGTLNQLAHLDLAYAPPFSMAISSSILAAHVLLNKIENGLKGISSSKLQKMLEQGDVKVIDVRTEEEYFIKSIPGSVNIPEPQLKVRLDEIPTDKNVVLVCKVGKRAYLSFKALRALGYTNIAILEGGINAYPYTLE
jgi:rhodanese-related sulfurtransferase